ncbi:class I SAM-dependent methyltransferase [Methanosarcina sp. MSH10X1]|uniref:class I SAM-dependent methyltransferase n=1 Tax=Methanosarcina sp. MSH10X1 TaxID=2507075 RepID=UPI000FFC896D|nr:class I SAM-dependent methyltransferase [Methanosarcina sp. MSH10X1]RXA20099.1 class I SAM-dependent methyltransferase [Methanosarcina sp. MSH10X1]
MGTLESEEKEIKVEEIMEKVRENISKRKHTGTGYTPGSLENPADSPEECFEEYVPQDELNYLASNWRMDNYSYSISSHRPFAGAILVKGRELVHGEVKRYVDSIISKQNEFNRTVASALNKLSRQVRSEVNREVTGKIESLKADLYNQMDQGIENLKTEVNKELTSEKDSLKLEIRKEINNGAASLKPEVCKEVDTVLNSFIYSLNTELENKIWLRSVLDKKIGESYELQEIKLSEPEELGINYFKFEERFRGSCEDIKGRQSKFFKYFEGRSNVLDIGCGRGEFLELLKEKGVDAKGVDLDEDMIAQCRSRGLCVELNDAVSYLEQLPDGSLDGIFIDQVVEHLKPEYLTKLLRLCYRKLGFGHYILIETVNPLSLFSFANFYIDLTHVKPVHPETLKFLLESTGFTELEVFFISPVSEEARLEKLPVFEGVTDKEKAITEIYNRNIDLLNSRLYGAQDYAVIGKK